MSASSSSSAITPIIPHPNGCRCDWCVYHMLPPSKQEESINNPPALLTIPSGVKKLMRGVKSGKGGFSKPIKVKLYGALNNITSAAASAMSINIAVVFNAGTFSELSSFAALYDEAKVTAVVLHFMPFVSANSSTAGTLNSFQSGYAIEFDPSVGGPSSIQSALESQHSVGPYLVGSTSSLTGIGLGTTLQKYKILRAKTPGPLAPIVVSDCPGSAWFCLDVTAPTIAVFNGYHGAMATAGTSTCSYMFQLDCEFRMRT